MSDQGSYKCVVESVISERSGGCIFKARLDDDRIVRVLVPYGLRNGAEVGRGQYYRITGIESDHPDYGPQIHTSSFVPASPSTTKNIVRFIAHAPEMRRIGIGKKKALALADCLGEELPTLLNAGDAKALAARSNQVLTEHSARALCERWQAHAELARAVQFLDRHTITGRMASLILGVYRERTVEALSADPYRLVAFRTPKRAAWEEVKKVARALGIRPGDDRELLGAAEFAIYKQHSQGHTATTAAHLLTEIAPLVGGKRQAQRALSLAREHRLAVDHRGLVQHIGARRLEEAIERHFHPRLTATASERASQGALFHSPYDAALISEQISTWEAVNFTLNKEQRKAVTTALASRTSVICGGAGVGKTSALRALAEIASGHGRDVHFLALAGRAAMRIQEATGFPARTIAGFVSDIKNERLQVQGSGLVVVDEASMISLPEIVRILRCAGNASLVLVGDDYQLPPISFGEVFPQLVESSRLPSTRLIQVYRQSEATGIPAASTMVRQQHIPEFRPYNGAGEGVSFVPCGTDQIETQVLETYLALSAESECQVICMTNGGLAGTKRINKLFQATFSRDNDQLVRDGVMVGDPVIYLVNDYEAGLRNGSLGTVTGIRHEGDPMVEVAWDGGFSHDIPLSGLHVDFEIAYAITCHKAQGSQFSKVIVPIRAARNLDSRMLYTAITRGKTQVVLVGDYNAFSEAVRRPPSELRRCVGFSLEPE